MFSRGAQIVHIWPCLKPYDCQTTSVNSPNFSGMLITLPNIEKITLSTLWLSKITDTQSWLFLALATNFWKFSNLATVLFLDIFCSCLEELLIKLSLTLENFIAKYQKVVRYLGPNLARNEKSRKVGGGAMVLVRQSKTAGFRLKSRYDMCEDRPSKCWVKWNKIFQFYST